MPHSKKALVLSGGGAKGAWGVGLLKALKEQGKTYDTVIGTSTGSLMGPLVLADKIQDLERAYTSVNQDKIFNVNPFKNNGDIKFWNAIGRLIGGKRTLGESEPLKKLILEFFRVGDFNRLNRKEKIFGASVSNLTSGQGEVKTWDQYSYLEMVDWIWASANNQIFMSHLDKEGATWADGGLNNYANISWVIDNTPELGEIDVIIHNKREPLNSDFEADSGIFKRLLRVIDILTAEIIKSDLQEAKLKIEIEENIDLNIFYMRQDDIDIIGNNSLKFDQKNMEQLLQKGYNEMKNGQIDSDDFYIDCDTNRICPRADHLA